jgi:hypothetical protein
MYSNNVLDIMSGIIAQLVERLIRIQEAWGSIPHCSTFLLNET